MCFVLLLCPVTDLLRVKPLGELTLKCITVKQKCTQPRGMSRETALRVQQQISNKLHCYLIKAERISEHVKDHKSYVCTSL